ncbi:serine/threonine-protein kinase [Calidifontibacter terrae]
METQQGRAGTRFGPYELRALIGRGGMGEVYRAYDTRKDREVALKLLPSDLAGDAQYRARFQREAQMAARLQEPHVIPIHDYGELGGVLFIDMRLVDGKDLRGILRRGSLMRPDAVVHIIGQIADALDAAHRDGLVHRDVKPENVLLLPSGFVYLADFGIAARLDEDRITSTGEALGSFSYMAPERFSDQPSGPAVDIYSLGCLTYELLAARPPFRRTSVSALIQAHLSEQPEPVSHFRSDVPAGLDDVIARALAKDPGQRQPTAGAFAHEARQALHLSTGRAQDPAQTASAPTARSASQTSAAAFVDRREPERSRQRPLLMGMISAVIVAAIGIGGYLVASQVFGSDDPATNSSPIGGPSDSNPGSTTGSIQGSITTDPSNSISTSSSPVTGRGSWPAILGDSSAGYDWQGWTAYSAVRCHSDDRALAVATTGKSFITICQAHSGSTYYLGIRPAQVVMPNSIELPNARRSGSGWTVTNEKESVDYDISPSGLSVTDRAHGKNANEAVTRYVGLSGQ